MLILPDLRVESFQAFLDEFQKFENSEVRLITDGAASHRSKRIKLDNNTKTD